MKVIAVTNRKLYGDNFFSVFQNITRQKPYAVILREKDLPYEQYVRVALKCKNICEKNNVSLIINSFTDAAYELGIKNIQLPYDMFCTLHETLLRDFERIWVSVHSIDEAVCAERLGAHSLIAGHIFPTQSKKGVPPRGLDFLSGICRSAGIDVFAIGGIDYSNAELAIKAGAAGVCMMSAFCVARKV